MKTLKTFMIMAVLFMGGMAMTGCEDSNVSNNQQPESQAEGIPMDSNEKKQVLDSINVLASQIEILLEGQETNTNSLKDMSKEMADLKGLSHLYDLISWVIAAIALSVAVIALIKLNSVQKQADQHYKDIEQRINSLEQKTNMAPSRNKTTNFGISNRECTSLTSRISKIERQLDKMNKGSEPQSLVPCNPVSVVGRSVNEQSGYFGLPTQMSLTEAYFKRLSDSRESDSRFKVEVRSDKAEFRPLEGTQYLNDLKSNDAIKMALNIQGCALSEATQMKVISFGEAKKDGDRWVITRKATITLSR